MQKPNDTCTCTWRPINIGRVLKTLSICLAVIVTFGIAGNAMAQSNCCEAHGGLGCDDQNCEDLICGFDPFCCNTAWDAFCLASAEDCCGICGGGPETCGDLGACCGAAIGDPICQDTTEGTCAANAGTYQGDGTSCAAGDCDVAPSECDCDVAVGVGCPANQACEDCVCGLDPFCCETAWDGLCVGVATGDCEDACCGEPEPASNCCVEHEEPGCDDPDCEAAVCGADPFCCSFNWDALCVEEAEDLCGDLCEDPGPPPPPGCGEAGTGDCCNPAGTGSPFCEDEECCTAVCANDPFCCDVEWDAFCGTFGFDPDCLTGPGTCGAQNTPECDCPPIVSPCEGATGDCLEAHGGIGCEDLECCEAVCAADAFCCDVAWDGLCAGAAATNPACVELGGCGDAGTGDCCDPAGTGTPACEDAECCEAVCANDPFCCDVTWDGFCATTGFDPDCIPGPGQCGALNTPECDCPELVVCPEGIQDGDCCDGTANTTPGCEDSDCCNQVCLADAFCCDVTWDGLCAGAANDICDVCQPDPHGCSLGFWKNHSANAPGGQSDLWVGYDADDIFDEVFAPEPETSNCCEAHGGIGCDDADCEALVCGADAFCCDVAWDGLCAGAADANCDVCQDGPQCVCDAPTGGIPGCDESQECEDCVCGQDAFCCNTSWDSLCAGAATGVCESACCEAGEVEPLGVFGDCTLHDVISSPSGGPNACGDTPHQNNLGKQAVAALLNATAGIDYPLTEEEVISLVSSALQGGDRTVIGDLQAELDELNNIGCPDFDQTDISGPSGLSDGYVDTFDMLEVMANWGPVSNERIADFNQDGVVDTFDLLELISNWGPAQPEWQPKKTRQELLGN